MKPEIIKMIAKRFAEEYYPKHASKFEIIWDMLRKMKLVFLTIARKALEQDLPLAERVIPTYRK